MGEDFCVGFREEGVSGGGEFFAEGAVVFDDAVVDEGNSIPTSGVGVGIFRGGWSMGGPAGVGNAGSGIFERRGFSDEIDEFRDLSFGLADGNSIGR